MMVNGVSVTKPRLQIFRTKLNALKWRCWSEQASFWGGFYERVGTGYSPEEAYRRWSRFGHHFWEGEQRA